MERDEFVYGYGRTKHIADPRVTTPIRGDAVALCGAYGGYPYAEPERPVCKRCQKKAAQ